MEFSWRLLHHPVAGDAPARQTVRFEFEGKVMEGREGEPIAVALLANGIRTLRFAENSGEPRGLFCGMGICYECRLTVDGERNVRSCITPLRGGMRIERETAAGRSQDAV